MFLYLSKAFAGGVPGLRFLNLRGMEEQLVSMMDQLTKAFLPWLCVKRWKISYCKSDFPRNRSVYWVKAQVSKESHKATWDGRVSARRQEGCVLYSFSHYESVKLQILSNLCYPRPFLKIEVPTSIPSFFMVRKHPEMQGQNGSFRCWSDPLKHPPCRWVGQTPAYSVAAGTRAQLFVRRDVVSLCCWALTMSQGCTQLFLQQMGF